MSRPNQPELPCKVYAEAVVRSVTGASLLRSSSLVTSENVLQFQAEPNLLISAAQRLKAAGFEILCNIAEAGKASISIAAAPEVYERSFRTTLEAVERPVLKEMAQPSTATFINSLDDKPFGEIDTSDTIWNEALDGIAINEPVYYSRPPGPAIAPPATTKKYLNVPDDVAQGLNATPVHQQGITGRGIRVVMIDSGWYPHPFFRHHNYKVNVVLGPGATAPERDDSGHGTGESANIFAIAPEAELTMIKFDVALAGKLTNVTSVAAFKRAIEQRPHIISCSWGSDQRSRQLSPQDKVLAAVIARAVREGIVVIFAVGNGSWGFPAQHPDAIAVGAQLAGICALMKQVDPSLSPARVKQILQQTARDVIEGFSNPVAGGHRACEGLDLATGYGLADAYASVEAVQGLNDGKCCNNCASPVQKFSRLNSKRVRRKLMSSEFPKLQAKFDEIISEFNKILEAKIESGDIEAVKLSISYENFAPRSASAILTVSPKPKNDSASTPAEIEGQKVEVSVINEKQRIVRYQDKQYKCESKQPQPNGDILYIGCTRM